MKKTLRVTVPAFFILLGMLTTSLALFLRAYLFSSFWGNGIVVLMGGLFGYFFSYPFNRFVHKFFRSLEEVAKGDLTVRLKSREKISELNLLVEKFNQHLVGGLQVILLGMKDLLEENRGLIRSFAQASHSSQEYTQNMIVRVENLKKRYQDLNGKIGGMLQTLSGLHQGVQKIVDQIGEQGGVIHQTSSSVEQMSASLESIANIALKKQEITQTLIQTSQEGGQKVSIAMDAMGKMSQGIEEIQKIVELINDVAARTNLLAMNAAIEATHAGQYGKGFAVVAAEIRKLAESTTSHTKKVGTTLKDFMEKMEYLNEAAQVAFQTIHKLHSEIITFVDAFGEIVRGTQEVSAGSKQMVIGIGTLRSSAETLTEASQKMRDQVDTIRTLVISLKEFSQESYAQLESLVSDLKHVESLQQDIAKTGRESIDHINTLATEMKYFRLEQHGIQGEDNYSVDLKEIILNHKRIVFSSKAFLQGRMELQHLPEPTQPCPLGNWINQLRNDTSLHQELNRLETKHSELHSTYYAFYQDALKGEKKQELVHTLEKRWKELILFREVIQKAMLALQEKHQQNQGKM
ncbi:MAG: methyl-accepting chemotaxis protein [Spirochaetales bacterium]